MDDKDSQTPDSSPVTENQPTFDPVSAYSPPQPSPAPAPILGPAPLPPAPVDAPPAAVADKKNSPGILVLQWLTYAFWGWCILALAWLTALSIDFLVTKTSTLDFDGSFIAYSLAAVIVLYVIALGSDIVYSRFEPQKKTGPATIIMVIHAVIFALFGIGSLIAAAFAIVNMLIDNSSSDGGGGPVVTLLTSLIIFVVYALTLVRTLHPAKIPNVTKIFWIAITVIILVVTSIGIFGPVAHTRLTRDDRLIEDSLPSLSQNINTYAKRNSKLPDSLETVKPSAGEDAKQLIDKKLVEYTPNTKQAQFEPLDLSRQSSLSVSTPTPISYYRLCVTFAAEKTDSYGYSDDYYSDEGDTSPDTYTHDKGKVCYDLQTDYGH